MFARFQARLERSRARRILNEFTLHYAFPVYQSSTTNVIAAICGFFIPGLGQLVQGRVLKAPLMFVLAGVLWLIWMGWIIHLGSIIDAALWKGPR